jgi:NTE family protein
MERILLADAAPAGAAPPGGLSAIVLGGGGVFGATQVGMLRALLESGFAPDMVIGTSVGALNGAAIAANPTTAGVDVLADLWSSLGQTGMFTENVLARASTLARYRTHVYSPAPLRTLLASHLPATFADLTIPFQCVAASIERSVAHWFSAGNLIDAVMASCAVPGLLPPVVIDGEHFLDGGLVHSIPVGRALALGATEIYVLHVGRIEQPLAAPRSLWDVCLISFEVARRHRFVEEMAGLPADVRVHVLPSGEERMPLVSMRYRHAKAAAARMQRGYEAATEYLSSPAGTA